MNGDKAPLLKISSLSVAIEDREVLSQVDLTLLGGEILALVGQSGAGKTLTALAILGLLPPKAVVLSGKIEFQGRDLLLLRKDELRRERGCEIALVFQDPRTALNPVMRIDEQLAEGMRYRLQYSKQESLRESIRALTAVGIQDPERCLRSYPHQLSGGMRQRILLATALTCRPRLLICDEITSSVDCILQSQLLALLDRLRREHKTSILLITHNLWSARQIADRVSVLLRGRVVEEGSTESIFNQPKHAFTRHLISSHRMLEGP